MRCTRYAQQENNPDGLDNALRKRLPLKRIGKSTRKCAFCFDEFEREQVIRTLPCSHYFHNRCLKPWFEKNAHCPVCRFDVKKFFEEDD